MTTQYCTDCRNYSKWPFREPMCKISRLQNPPPYIAPVFVLEEVKCADKRTKATCPDFDANYYCPY